MRKLCFLAQCLLITSCLVTIDATGIKSQSQKIVGKEAAYQKNREEFRYCAVIHNVSDLSETIHWESAKTVGVIISYRKEKGK
ncbi:hypothetical protein HH219_06930 [Pseudoalteromonas sp. NEC-BIFX-2020_015]|uniref:hypothetical protein n=1 Tax=Pseudoalteromonas sp. NEC-BIFX-2020_015 TaxID=2729544 RepID=UPI0014613A2A|nr:hypothetical protein [Pseudoalteromonas sp. NEC-BIFX-2020_015]NMR25271.1 hypothetical protein [Pseudoalteromonas sp. NEC-BIFX-2020_015]